MKLQLHVKTATTDNTLIELDNIKKFRYNLRLDCVEFWSSNIIRNISKDLRVVEHSRKNEYRHIFPINRINKIIIIKE